MSGGNANAAAADCMRGFYQSLFLPKPDRSRRRAAAKIQASLCYMLHHVDKPINARALSDLAGMSPSSFFSLFKQATGSTPIDFLNRLRMHRARELIAHTDRDIAKKIAYSLGYQDPFYFSRRFKSAYGVSPAHYREAVDNSAANVKSCPVENPFLGISASASRCLLNLPCLHDLNCAVEATNNGMRVRSCLTALQKPAGPTDKGSSQRSPHKTGHRKHPGPAWQPGLGIGVTV